MIVKKTEENDVTGKLNDVTGNVDVTGKLNDVTGNAVSGKLKLQCPLIYPKHSSTNFINARKENFNNGTLFGPAGCSFWYYILFLKVWSWKKVTISREEDGGSGSSGGNCGGGGKDGGGGGYIMQVEVVRNDLQHSNTW